MLRRPNALETSQRAPIATGSGWNAPGLKAGRGSGQERKWKRISGNGLLPGRPRLPALQRRERLCRRPRHRIQRRPNARNPRRLGYSCSRTGDLRRQRGIRSHHKSQLNHHSMASASKTPCFPIRCALVPDRRSRLRRGIACSFLRRTIRDINFISLRRRWMNCNPWPARRG